MIEVRQTPAFRGWFRELRDMRTKAQIVRRIERAQAGNLGDVAPVSEGVSEMRIHYGPGYRLYFVQRGAEIIILLCGGDKSSQSKDIRAAKAMAKEI
jgi:putative addiction module killer protein